MIRRLLDAYRSHRLRRDIAAGRKDWGRQPSLNVHITTRARVIRADGSEQDLGVIDQREI